MRITASVLSAIGLFIGLATATASAQSIVNLNPKTITFHVFPERSAAEKVTLRNNDTGLSATINSIEIGTQCCGNGKFNVVSHTCGAPLAPGHHCTITVEFIAGRGGEETKSALEVKFHIDGVAQTDTVALAGAIN
jgi:hypothetical protein